jgi:hypothetical protein
VNFILKSGSQRKSKAWFGFSKQNRQFSDSRIIYIVAQLAKTIRISREEITQNLGLHYAYSQRAEINLDKFRVKYECGEDYQW